MIAFKILAPILVLLLSLIQFYLDHKFKDKRTKSYKRTKAVFLTIIGVAVVFSIVTIIIDDNNSKDLSNKLGTLQDEMKSLSKQSSKSDSLNISFEGSAKLERKKLELQITALQSQLSPFLNLALKKYPNLPVNEALLKLQADINDLRDQTSQLKDKTDYIESRNRFKPLDNSLRISFISKLKNVKLIYPDIHLIISVENGNILRNNIAEELKDILSKSGYTNVEIRPVTTFWSGTPPSCVIKARKEDEYVAQQFFQPFIDNIFVDKPTGNYDDKIGQRTFGLHLVGNPIFENNGKIKL